MAIKNDFKLYFSKELENSNILKEILFKIFVKGSAYIIGGYFRDFLLKKEPRDIDILVDTPHSFLLEILHEKNIPFTVNRHNGIKVKLETKSLDIWSVENNWAFKERLISFSEYDKLNSIAKGCFYNYDALVINLRDYSYNLRYYRKFVDSKVLDIFYSSTDYLNLNETIEANVLRAFYLKKIYDVSFSDRTRRYLINKIGELADNNENIVEVLDKTISKYPKYTKELNYKKLLHLLDELYSETNNENSQLFLNL